VSKVKVSVLYPRSEGSTFDMDYYNVTHREIVERALGPVEFSCEEGLPDQPFMATGHLVHESLEAMQSGMGGPDAGEAMADVANFTNVTPQLQIGTIID
jgi:uncharacterized protein (TIGR02118 family)